MVEPLLSQHCRDRVRRIPRGSSASSPGDAAVSETLRLCLKGGKDIHLRFSPNFHMPTRVHSFPSIHTCLYTYTHNTHTYLHLTYTHTPIHMHILIYILLIHITH